MTDGRMGRVRQLVSLETAPVTSDGVPAGPLTLQCQALARAVSACGTGISVVDPGRLGVSLASSGPAAAALDELQFKVGEGPSLEAFDSGRLVLEPDLADHGRARWPWYAPAVTDRGVRSVFAFPMQVGMARLAVLAVYRSDSGPLSAESVDDALAFAALGVETMLGGAADGALRPDLDDAVEHHAEIYQAQGMVMVQLGIPLTEAMVRLRAHAYGQNIPLSRLAADIVARRTTLDDDRADRADPMREESP